MNLEEFVPFDVEEENEPTIFDEDFVQIDPSTIEEDIVTLVDNDAIRVVQIVSKGACSKRDLWYDDNFGEFIYMLKGVGVIQFEEGYDERLNKGNNIYIAPHMKHRVSYTSADAVWLCVYHKL